jgi:hypothetical protein
MKSRSVRHMRHTTKLKTSRAFDTRGSNKDSILQNRGEGKTYKQLNVDGQKFFIRLFSKFNRKG